MDKITFDQVPSLLGQILDEVNTIKSMVQIGPQEQKDTWFSLEQLVEYDPVNRSKATYYRYVRERLIPFHKKGKNLFFLKSEIDEWLRSGRFRTIEEIQRESEEEFVKSKRSNL